MLPRPQNLLGVQVAAVPDDQRYCESVVAPVRSLDAGQHDRELQRLEQCAHLIRARLGPPIGGLLIYAIGWRGVFWINVPICATAMVLTAIFVPESRSARTRRFDPVGQLLAALTLFGSVYALIEGPRIGWLHPAVIATAALAIAACLAFARYERRCAEPFIELRFLRSIPFASATFVTLCAFAVWGSFLFMMSLYLQGVRHYSALHSGLIFLPIAAGALVFSPLSGRLVGRFGNRPSLMASGLLTAIASVMLLFLSEQTPVWVLLLIFALAGIGFAMVSAPTVDASVNGMSPERAGAASAVNSTSKQVGVSIGIALCGLLAEAALSMDSAQFTSAVRPLWLLNAGLGLTIAALGVLSTTPWAERSGFRERDHPVTG